MNFQEQLTVNGTVYHYCKKDDSYYNYRSDDTSTGAYPSPLKDGSICWHPFEVTGIGDVYIDYGEQFETAVEAIRYCQEHYT